MKSRSTINCPNLGAQPLNLAPLVHLRIAAGATFDCGLFQA